MKGEQLQLMKVIEFPKNRQVENQLRHKKLEVAMKLLEAIIDDGAEYHIVINREDTLKLFEYSSKIGDYLIMTSDVETAKKIKIDNKKCCVFEIKGDEIE